MLLKEREKEKEREKRERAIEINHPSSFYQYTFVSGLFSCPPKEESTFLLTTVIKVCFSYDDSNRYKHHIY